MSRSIMSAACVFVFLLAALCRPSQSSSNQVRTPDDEPKTILFGNSATGSDVDDLHMTAGSFSDETVLRAPEECPPDRTLAAIGSVLYAAADARNWPKSR